jgi:hypothetical protein
MRDEGEGGEIRACSRKGEREGINGKREVGKLG